MATSKLRIARCGETSRPKNSFAARALLTARPLPTASSEQGAPLPREVFMREVRFLWCGGVSRSQCSGQEEQESQSSGRPRLSRAGFERLDGPLAGLHACGRVS